MLYTIIWNYNYSRYLQYTRAPLRHDDADADDDAEVECPHDDHEDECDDGMMDADDDGDGQALQGCEGRRIVL